MTSRSTDHADFKRVLPDKAARFSPLDERPLTGTWSPEDLPDASVTLPAMSQAILINPETCRSCID
jgi:hypothetical protein